MALSDLATEAVALIAGYALAIGQDVADKARTGIADRLYNLIKNKLSRRASDSRALENLMHEPANVLHQEVVAAALDDAVSEDPAFGAQLRHEVMVIRTNNQVATTTGPVSGNQIISHFGPGVSMTDSIVNNQGTIDQSTHTVHDRRKTIRKRGIPPVWLAIIVLAVGLVLSGVTVYIIIGINQSAHPAEATPSRTRPLQPASERDGCKAACNLIFETNPYNAVGKIYSDIANGDLSGVCLRFTQEAGEQFATNLGFGDCEEAARVLHDQVSNKNDYVESIPWGRDVDDVKSVRISSCHDNNGYGIRGGPSLGIFLVEEISGSIGGQWIITGHEKEDC